MEIKMIKIYHLLNLIKLTLKLHINQFSNKKYNKLKNFMIITNYEKYSNLKVFNFRFNYTNLLFQFLKIKDNINLYILCILFNEIIFFIYNNENASYKIYCKIRFYFFFHHLLFFYLLNHIFNLILNYILHLNLQ